MDDPNSMIERSMLLLVSMPVMAVLLQRARREWRTFLTLRRLRKQP